MQSAPRTTYLTLLSLLAAAVLWVALKAWLWGVPFAIKDLVLHADGVPQRAGSRLLGPGVPLEHDREALGVLRHHRRRPAAAAPLVEQVGERVLVVAQVAREAHHHGLVLFHARQLSSLARMANTPAAPAAEFPQLTVVAHPLVQHKLAILRDRATPTKIFKELVDEIATLMAYEATRDMKLSEVEAQKQKITQTEAEISGTDAHRGRKRGTSAPTAPAAPTGADMSLPLPNGLKGDPIAGKKLFVANCATCHGDKGDGKGPRAYFINPRPKNFLEAGPRATLNRPTLYTFVSAGKLGTEMPAWSKVMTPQEIAKIVHHFADSPLPPRAPPPRRRCRPGRSRPRSRRGRTPRCG